jgi:hypothetical protein
MRKDEGGSMSYWVYINKSDRLAQLRLDDRDSEPKHFDVSPEEDVAFEASAIEDASIWVTHEGGGSQSYACVTRGVVSGLCEEISEDEAR